MSEPEPSEHQPWEEAYQLAVSESDAARLLGRIEMAKSAIALRISELQGLPSLGERTLELHSITQALEVLRLLAEYAPSRERMVL
jgi:hypothetical protein